MATDYKGVRPMLELLALIEGHGGTMSTNEIKDVLQVTQFSAAKKRGFKRGLDKGLLTVAKTPGPYPDVYSLTARGQNVLDLLQKFREGKGVI